MSIMSKFTQIARNWQRQRLAARTARKIDSLPFDMRKDIGWPDRYTSEMGRHPAHDVFGR